MPQPVAGLASISYLMLVNPGVPAKNLAEFIAYAKANPGKINFASGGVGSSNQLAAELFKVMTGTNLVHVPYRGNAAAYTDPDRRTNPAHLRRYRVEPAACTVRRVARARCYGAGAPRNTARRAGDRRNRSGLRGERLVRLRGPEGDAA